MDDRPPQIGVEGDPVAAPPGPLDRFAGDQVEPNVLPLRRGSLDAVERDQLGHEPAHLRELLGDVGEQALPLCGWERVRAGEHLDVRAQARQRGPELVRGVGDETPLGGGRLLERGQHLVEARGEPAELVAALVVHPPRESRVALDLLGRAPLDAAPGERRARDDQAERGGEADAARA